MCCSYFWTQAEDAIMAGKKENSEGIMPRSKHSAIKYLISFVLSAHLSEWLHGLNQLLGARKCYHTMNLKGRELKIFSEQYSLLPSFSLNK